MKVEYFKNSMVTLIEKHVEYRRVAEAIGPDHAEYETNMRYSRESGEQARELFEQLMTHGEA